jgi:hypothetical protein
MLLEFKPWVHDSPAPFHKLVWALFETPPVSSVSNRPKIFRGTMQYINDKPMFWEEGALEPLHPHWVMIAWRYV